jgi:phage shock protein A
MGIISRFFNVIRSNLNVLLNRAEDPTKLLEQTLIDMEGAFQKAKEQVAGAVAGEKRLDKSLADAENQIVKWNNRAVQAVEQGNDDLAREALRRKADHTRIAAQFENESIAHSANVDNLKGSLRELETKISDIKRRKTFLMSKQKRIEAQNSIYKTVEGIQSIGAIDTIERMEEKIEDMAAITDARMEMSDEFQGDQLEKKFKELDSGPDVDVELLELKNQLQLENKGS